jgi:head-tail adaptor
MVAGELYHRIRFEKRTQVTNEYGDVEEGFEAQFVRSAGIRPLKGGEAVMAARLGGVQPVLMRVRIDSQTQLIRPDWQAVDTRDGTIYAINSIADMEQRRQYYTIVAQAGVAS